MELIELKDKILEHFKGTKTELDKILNLVNEDKSVFPFNEYEFLICNLLEKGKLTFSRYLQIREAYRQANPNLWMFEITAPRGFGEIVEGIVKEWCKKLQYPNVALDKKYNGQYDLWLEGIRIEVKSSRAVDSDSKLGLFMKALSRNTKKNFLMNFQQLKPQHCDVFIWVAVFRDQKVVWIMSSKEVLHHPLYSKGQHRGNSGNEGQLHINETNIHQLDKFVWKNDNLEKAIRDAAKQNTLTK